MYVVIQLMLSEYTLSGLRLEVGVSEPDSEGELARCGSLGQRWGWGQVAVACSADQEWPLDLASGKAVGPSLAPQQGSAGWVSGQGPWGVGMDTESSSGRVFPDPKSLPSLTAGHFSEP